MLAWFRARYAGVVSGSLPELCPVGEDALVVVPARLDVRACGGRVRDLGVAVQCGHVVPRVPYITYLATLPGRAKGRTQLW